MNSRKENLLTGLTVFVTGFSIMSIEITGSRIVAPYLGNSLIVWTCLIGIILLSLSLGSLVGGKLSDQRANFLFLVKILLVSSFCLVLIALFKYLLLETVSTWKINLYLKSLSSILVLFAPISFFLGIIHPYVTRLNLKELSSSGKTVGYLSAISTIGSILGTFVTGFWLISNLGNTVILYFLSILLALVALLNLLYAKCSSKPSLIGIFFLVVFNSFCFLITKEVHSKNLERNFIDIDTKYQRVWILDSINNLTKEKVRLMKLNNQHSSAMLLENPFKLPKGYAISYRLAEHFKGDFIKTLMIGGAAYTYPKFYLKKFPNKKIDVVEIDPALTKLAKEHFYLDTANKNLRIFHQDGRVFLNQLAQESNPQKYDLILLDAFNSIYSIPFYLTTKEALKKIYKVLKSDGIVISNIISSIEGRNSGFYQAELETYLNVFPQVEVFPVYFPNDRTKTQNLAFVAFKQKQSKLNLQNKDPQIQNLLDNYHNHRFSKDKENRFILKDDFAPTNKYILNMI